MDRPTLPSLPPALILSFIAVAARAAIPGLRTDLAIERALVRKQGVMNDLEWEVTDGANGMLRETVRLIIGCWSGEMGVKTGGYPLDVSQTEALILTLVKVNQLARRLETLVAVHRASL